MCTARAWITVSLAAALAACSAPRAHVVGVETPIARRATAVTPPEPEAPVDDWEPPAVEPLPFDRRVAAYLDPEMPVARLVGEVARRGELRLEVTVLRAHDFRGGILVHDDDGRVLAEAPIEGGVFPDFGALPVGEGAVYVLLTAEAGVLDADVRARLLPSGEIAAR